MNQKGDTKIVLSNSIKLFPRSDDKDDVNNNNLHHIVYTGDITSVQNFLKTADEKGNLESIINEYNEDGRTPLHVAVMNNFQDIAELLIANGASKNIVDEKGQKVIWVPEQKGGNDSKIYGKRYI